MRKPRRPKKLSDEPEPFILQELPDPTQHLREDQKLWPLVSTERPPREAPVNPAESTPAETPQPRP